MVKEPRGSRTKTRAEFSSCRRGKRPRANKPTTTSALGYDEPRVGVGHASRAHTPNQRRDAPDRGTRPPLLPDSPWNLAPTGACAGLGPRPFALPPGSPAAKMAAPCVSCGAAASYRLFLGGRVSLARKQGVWKAAAAELQTGTGFQVREKWKRWSV